MANLRTYQLTLLVILSLSCLPAMANRDRHFNHDVETVIIDSNTSFKIHRVNKNIPAHRLRGPVIVFHGNIFKFSNFAENKHGGFKGSLVHSLAAKGYDVYGYDPRNSDLTLEQCADPSNCAFTQDWGMQALLDDLEVIKSRIAAIHGDKKPVFFGYSQGAITAIAAANATPNDFSGLVLFEGFLASNNTDVIDVNTAECTMFTDALANGQYNDLQSMPTFQFILQLAALDPSGDSPLIPGFSNRQVKFLILSTPQTVNIPNRIDVVGSLALEQFTYTDEAFADYLIENAIPVVPNKLQADTACAIAGQITQWTDNLAAYTGPILAFKADLAFGQYMEDNLALFSSAASVERVSASFGHADFLTAKFSKGILHRPLILWLQEHVF